MLSSVSLGSTALGNLAAPTPLKGKAAIIQTNNDGDDSGGGGLLYDAESSSTPKADLNAVVIDAPTKLEANASRRHYGKKVFYLNTKISTLTMLKDYLAKSTLVSSEDAQQKDQSLQYLRTAILKNAVELAGNYQDQLGREVVHRLSKGGDWPYVESDSNTNNLKALKALSEREFAKLKDLLAQNQALYQAKTTNGDESSEETEEASASNIKSAVLLSGKEALEGQANQDCFYISALLSPG